MTLKGQADRQETSADGRYEAPALVSYGTIEEWTHGLSAQILRVSIVI